ncbi:MAG: hypothetical protein BWY32_01375 [bacterium ADurb.Bin243]|nr:MAG: hypothetical protein BWY32_01375 [bacterium ADurb.Bin243]HOD42090.1 hypothetical protein [Candidatus Wallbacteria bacterium]
MEAIRINDVVGSDGIFIDIKKLEQFKNKKVEIIILPMDESKKTKQKNARDFAGSISEKDSREMLIAMDECRKIDVGEWK